MCDHCRVTVFGSVMSSEIAETPEVFRRIIKAMPTGQIITDAISMGKIQSVLILARGTSDNAAHFLKYLIETQIGLPCGLTSPSSVTLYKSTLHFRGTLVIAISQSGQSPDLVQFATAARNAGAKIISMTNDSQSPLAELAHLHLALHAGPELAVAATKTYSAQLFTSYLLVAALANFPNHETQIVHQAQKLVASPLLVGEAVNACDLSEEIVVLGRGFAYPNARELALKIQETSKVSVQGLSTADYLHGPISALTRKTQVFIVAPLHMPIGSIDEAVTKIRPQVERIFWVGNGGTPQGNDIVIAGAHCKDEIATSIVDAISVQRFALEFAKKSGFNPDAPEGLSKVTLTH